MSCRARRVLTLGTTVAVATLVAAGCVGTDSATVDAADDATAVDAVGGGDSDGAGAPSTTSTTSTTTTTAAPRPPANTLELAKLRTVSGDISPKSVVASGTGLVTAQNMMYTHTVTAYDSDGELLATIPDTVRLSDFGIDKEGEYQGAPVEAAFTPGGEHVYVSNYSMYGPGFREGSDKCSPSDGTPPSYLYRISTETWKIDQVVPAGAVPKYVAVTPDGAKVLATNWCTWDLTIADTETGTVTDTIDIGRYPRGIAVTQDSSTAYIAVMGTTDVARVNLADGSISWIRGVGQGPRHIVLSPDDKYAYVTLNAEGRVAKIDTATGQVVEKVATGSQPRSLDISTDGTAVYVVNYDSSTMTKLATADMSTLQEVTTGYHPIGITYDDLTGRIWVANYGGTIDIWDETPAG